MRVKRIVANVETADLAKAEQFYRQIFGLELLMDHGWIRTYGNSNTAAVQISFAVEGGSNTPVPDFSIEVDDLDEALTRIEVATIPIEYGPRSESRVSDAFSSAIRSVS